MEEKLNYVLDLLVEHWNIYHGSIYSIDTINALDKREEKIIDLMFPDKVGNDKFKESLHSEAAKEWMNRGNAKELREAFIQSLLVASLRGVEAYEYLRDRVELKHLFRGFEESFKKTKDKAEKIVKIDDVDVYVLDDNTLGLVLRDEEGAGNSDLKN